MKKALVLSLLVLGLGLAASAQLTGYWSTTIGIDPTPASFDLFLTKLNSTLSVGYTLSGWTFSAVSTFDLGGFATQSFKVVGSLGAFSLESNMSFDPAFITERTYLWPGTLTSVAGTTGLYYTNLCPLDFDVTKVAPRFLSWDVTAGVSIAGVEVEAYVLQDYSNAAELNKAYLWLPGTGVPTSQTDAVVCQSYDNGMGWRLMLAGTFGDVTVTSYTYFNLTEWDLATYYSVYTYLPSCPTIGKSGVFFVGDGCSFPFVEEYLMIEGFTFGCATIDAALSILCTGFADVTFVVSDISLGGWATLDFGITFTTVSKSFATCISLNKLLFDCLVVELGFGSGAYGTVTNNVIENIYVHGISFSTTFGGVKFSSVTEFDAASLLMSSAVDYTYFYGGAWAGWFVPYVGEQICFVDDCCEDDVILDEYWGFNEAYEVKCAQLERYRLWEKFVIDVDADACCGGLFDLTIATFFGEHQILDWAGYATYAAGSLAPSTPVDLYKRTSTSAAYSYSNRSSSTYDSVSFKTKYVADTVTTLFDWAKTSVDLGVGIGSGITLTAGFDITAFGWDLLEFGFKWTF